jgi:oligosaccharide translocation protein RFT1
MSGMLGIGVCSVIFSQGCAQEFILLVYSEKWATNSTVDIMKAYCFYLMFMAMNGMAEAFAYGLANQKVLN